MQKNLKNSNIDCTTIPIFDKRLNYEYKETNKCLNLTKTQEITITY